MSACSSLTSYKGALPFRKSLPASPGLGTSGGADHQFHAAADVFIVDARRSRHTESCVQTCSLLQTVKALTRHTPPLSRQQCFKTVQTQQ